MSTANAVKERPILFSAPMVQAILDGRKTQTRRILTKSTEFKGPYNPEYLRVHRNSEGWKTICPFGGIGDRLWVRETFAPVCTFDPSPETGAIYRADIGMGKMQVDWSWTPSIHMPRWASRINLEITDVRVERLNDISEADAIAEGVARSSNGRFFYDYRSKAMNAMLAAYSFMTLWNSINGEESWEANPWVWVVTFKKLERIEA